MILCPAMHALTGQMSPSPLSTSCTPNQGVRSPIPNGPPTKFRPPPRFLSPLPAFSCLPQLHLELGVPACTPKQRGAKSNAKRPSNEVTSPAFLLLLRTVLWLRLFAQEISRKCSPRQAFQCLRELHRHLVSEFRTTPSQASHRNEASPASQFVSHQPPTCFTGSRASPNLHLIN